ncbi:UDP-N-acetylmuramate--L-alanine ligase [soil metagenome]
MNLANLHSVFFIGIGGIGMSALARYFRHNGAKVVGYDRTETALTKQLVVEGMEVHYEDNIALIPADAELVIYTPAIPKDHKQLNHLRNEGKVPVLKRSEVLEILTKDKFTIAIGGSHGKTTVTSMTAHVLTHSGFGCTAFLGGIATNYHSNFISGNPDVIVVEADEFDRSFLRLHPNIAVITAVDTDHLDIYGSREAIEDTFVEFVGKLQPDGMVIAQQDVTILSRIQDKKVITYGINDGADYQAKDIAVSSGKFEFSVAVELQSSANAHPSTPLRMTPALSEGNQFATRNSQPVTASLAMGGRHNVLNATAATAVALQLGISMEKIAAAISSFNGIQRRFEYIINTPSLVFIDDYAHHPEEIRACISAARELYPDKRITAVFQPHLFSRTNDLYPGFAESLQLADEVILMNIYPARELPMAGVTSVLILDAIPGTNKALVADADLVAELVRRQPEVLLTIGAGDIDKHVDKIKHSFTLKNPSKA